MNRDFITHGLIRRGYAPHLAEGISWNLQDESSFKPRAIGDSGNAIGLAQWNGRRKRALEQWAASQGRDHWDPETQLDFLDYELKGSEKNAYQKLLAAKTPAEAAIAFNTYFERPAEENLKRRNAKYASLGGIQYSPVEREGSMSFLPQDDQQEIPQGAFTPFMDAGAGIYSDPSVRAHYVEPEGEPLRYQKWLREKLPWLEKQSNRDTLLAIGAGLLSGDDWASGGAAAAQNVLALRQQDRKRDEERLGDAAQHARNMQRQSSADNVKKYRIGNVKMPDGSFRSDLSHGTDGRIYDGAGNPIDSELAAQIIEVNNSLAGGDKGQLGANEALKTQATLMTQKAGLEAIDRVYTYLDNDPEQGLGKVMQSVDAMYRTLMDRGLTEEQINRAVAEGDMQALIGQTREAVVGPGVMTEPDAVRVMAALGGDLKSLLRNPDAFKARLEVVYKDMFSLYNTGYEQYETIRQAYPNLNYIQLDRYQGRTVPPVGTTAQQAAQGAQPVEAKSTNITSPTIKAGDIEFTQEELEALSPEDREFVLQQAGQTAPLNQSKGDSDIGEGVFSGLTDDGPPSHYPFGPEVWAALPDDVKRQWIEIDPLRR